MSYAVTSNEPKLAMYKIGLGTTVVVTVTIVVSEAVPPRPSFTVS